MAVSTAQVGNLSITTQILPATDDAATASGAKKTPVTFKAHKELHMKALGTVLILAGLMQISFGIIMTAAEEELYSLTTQSRVYFWGGLVGIYAGCMTVVLATTENVKMIKASLGSNAVNAVLGAVALILYMVQLYRETTISWITQYHDAATHCNLSRTTDRDSYDYYYYYGYDSEEVYGLRVAVSSLVLLFALTAFFTSVSVIVLGRKVLNDEQYFMLN